MGLPLALYEQIFDVVPTGLMVVASDGKITAWNQWLEKNSGLKAKTVLNNTLAELYPDIKFIRYEWALEQVVNYGNPQILSQALNHYLIPIAINLGAFQNIDRMQQHVVLLPVESKGKPYALVVIQDVTDKFYQRTTLMSKAHQLETETYVDALTGIYNRRYLWEWLDRTMGEALEEGFTIECCLFDIDHFKSINDTYGHEVGDEVILSFVEVVRQNLREGDIFVRYGGEEFITLLPKMKAGGTGAHAKRVLKMFADKKTHGSLERKVTCSAGAALWRPGQGDLTAKALIEKADKCLYEAKEAGRNRVRCYKKAKSLLK